MQLNIFDHIQMYEKYTLEVIVNIREIVFKKVVKSSHEWNTASREKI